MILSEMWNSFSNYSQESTIHSINYIGKQSLHWIERVFWIVSFLFSLTTCSYLIILTYKKWDSDPVLVTFNERSTPTWTIPIPAMTICPESKTNVEKFNLSSVIERVESEELLTEEEEIGLEVFSQICGAIETPKNSTLSKGNYIKILRKIQNEFAQMSSIEIAGNEFGAFKEVITDEGICYTINMLDEKDLYRSTMNDHLRQPKVGHRSDWSVFGYNKSDGAGAYPFRILGSGVKTGLTISLVTRKKDVSYACKKTSGYRLSFHTPDEMPEPRSHFYRIPFAYETLINVLPRKMSTAHNLKHYTPEQRQCYFRNEKRLSFFKHYNQANCKLECFTNLTLKMCDCVKFSMPNTYGTKICNTNYCPELLEKAFTFLELQKSVGGKEMKDWKELAETMINIYNFKHHNETSDYYEEDEQESGDHEDESDESDDNYQDPDIYKDPNYAEIVEGSLSSCQCLPSCTSIHYDAEISQTNHNVVKYYKANQIFDKEDQDYYYSTISVYFKEDNFIESKRTELYGWINFLSNCGGFLGLLMGGSLLSLVEIFYHLTMRKIFHKTNQVADDKPQTINF